MRRHARKLAILVLLAMSALIAGCAGSAGGGGTTAAATAAATTAAAAGSAATTAAAGTAATTAAAGAASPYGEHVSISWVPQNDHEVPADAETKLAVEEMFNWTVDFIYMDRNNETELLNTRLAAGEIPDVMRLHTDARRRQMVDQGVVKDLDPALIQQYAPTMYTRINGLFNGITDDIWELIKIDGKIYDFPVGNLNNTYSRMPIWRDDWLAKNGITEPPTEWDDIVAAFQFFKDGDPDGDGQANTYALSNTGMNYLRDSAFGGDAFTFYTPDASGKLVPNVLTGNYRNYVETMADFYSQGLIDPEFITGENQGQYWALSVSFVNSVIGFACPGSYYHTNPPLFEGSTSSSTNWQAFYEQNPDGTKTYAHGKTVTGPTGLSYVPSGVAIPGERIMIGRNIDEAAYIRFLQFHEAMFTDYDLYRLVVDGIKDMRYYDVELPDGRLSYQNYTQEELDAAGHPNANKGLYTGGFGYLAEDCWDFLKRRDITLYDYADQNATPEVLGGTPGINLVWAGMTRTATNKVDMDTILTQNFQLFVTGQRPLSEWDAFIDELYGVGMQEWIDECNEWYAANS